MSDVKSLSRRAVLALGAGFLPAVATTAAVAEAPKVSKDCVHFRTVGLEDHKCGECRLFRGPSSCLAVAGAVSKDCGCRIWLPKIA